MHKAGLKNTFSTTTAAVTKLTNTVCLEDHRWYQMKKRGGAATTKL